MVWVDLVGKTEENRLSTSKKEEEDEEEEEELLGENSTNTNVDKMIRYIRKKPVSAATICALVLWLTVLAIVAMKTIDLEVERINLSRTDIQQLILTMTNVTLNPLLMVQVNTNETVMYNLQLPPIDMKRKKLIRDWLQLSMIGTNGTHINNTNINSSIEYIPWHVNQTTTKLLTSNEQYISMRGRKLLKSHVVMKTGLTKNNTEQGRRNNTVDILITLGNETVETTNNIQQGQTHGLSNKLTYFKLSRNGMKDLLHRKRKRLRHQRKDESIPDLLQNEIGPISEYKDKIKRNETLLKEFRYKFKLPFREERTLRKRVRRLRLIASDTDNPRAVREAVGPVSDYNGKSPESKTDNDDDWMLNFGHRYQDDEDDALYV